MDAETCEFPQSNIDQMNGKTRFTQDLSKHLGAFRKCAAKPLLELCDIHWLSMEKTGGLLPSLEFRLKDFRFSG